MDNEKMFDDIFIPLEGMPTIPTNEDAIKDIDELESSNALIDAVEDIFAEALTILRKKNHDYTPKDDPISNFRFAETLGITSTERAIMVRLLDKIVRIAIGLNKEYMIKDEKMKDNILDAINYLGILYYALEVGNIEKSISSIGIDNTGHSTNVG